MSFVLTRLNQPSDIVDILFLPLVNSSDSHLIVVRRQAIDIYGIGPAHELDLQKSITILDTILDVKPWLPLELPGTWLVITTESNKTLLVAFRESIERDMVVEELDIRDSDYILSFQPGTLCTESGKFLATYTTQGSLCIYPIHKSKDLKNFVKAFDPNTKTKQQLFKKPSVLTLTNMQGRSPLVLEAIVDHYEERFEDITFSVIYRDELYNYFSAYFSLVKGQLEQNDRLKLPDEISPIIVPIRKNTGSILFGKTGIFIRHYPGQITSLSTAASLTSHKEGHTIETGEVNGTVHYIKKTLPKPWKVTSALVFNTEPFDKLTQILINTTDGFVYYCTLESEIKLDNFGYPDQLVIESWSIRRFSQRVSMMKKIVQISKDIFVGFSNRDGLVVLKVDTEKMALEVLNTKNVTPSILDFNIAGTAIPKVQILGGSGMTNGLIRTEFEGYDSNIVDVGKVRLTEGVTGIWKFGDVYIVNHLDGLRIFEDKVMGIVESDDYYGLKNVDGSVLDLSVGQGGLICVSESGVYQNGELVSKASIQSASIMANGSPVYVSEGILKHKGETYKLSNEASCIHSVFWSKRAYIVVGTWNGETSLFTKGAKKVIWRSDLAAHSVKIMSTEDSLVYIIGGSDGSVVVIAENQTTEFSIGSAPVTVILENSHTFIVYNKENVLRVKVDASGDVVEKGFLNQEIPEAMFYDRATTDIVTLTHGHIGKLKSSNDKATLQNEIPLNRLPRKSTKFKNYLNLSLIVTVTEQYNTTLGRNVLISKLEVMDNNTFKIKSIFKFQEGIEVTDVVNTTYRKDIIDTYEEEKINMGFENVLSQCFVVNCVYHMQDESGPPLMLFSIDEHGTIQHQCSSESSDMSFYSLTNHANRMVIGAGTKVCAYRIHYSVADSKFSLKRISDPYETRYYTSAIKSVGPDVVVGDIMKCPTRLRLKVKDNPDEGGTVFEFKEKLDTFDPLSFLTAMEAYENLVITTDSLKNVQVSLLTSDTTTTISQFNICDQINVVRKIERQDAVKLTAENIVSLFVEGKKVDGIPDIFPMFLLGSVGGGLYLLSLATNAELVNVLEDAQEEVIKNKLKTLAKDKSEEARVEQYVRLRNWRGSRRNVKPMLNFIDGDLIREYDEDIAKDIITENCKLL